jgi:Transposase and inactivated derivatives
MPTHQTIPFQDGTFFITFTCYHWLPLIDKTNGYGIIYNWFDHLKSKGHKINGFVIMPNHVHVLISFISTSQSINTIIGNGKRFMAYEMVKQLQKNREFEVLSVLKNNVEAFRKTNNKKHDVWELSFDWKYCNSWAFIVQKLNYMHENPCAGKWNLCRSPVDYIHSSAKFYLAGENGLYIVTDVEDG